MAAGPAVRKLHAEHPEQVRLVLKLIPFEPRPHAMLAAEAALAAGDQGKFWAMHDKLLQEAPRFSREDLLRYAGELGLDQQRFAADLDTPQHRQQIERDRQLARQLKIVGTPTFFINGRKVEGNAPYSLLAGMVEEESRGQEDRGRSSEIR